VNAARERDLRVAMVGISIDESCGVRDYATVLLPALGKEGVDCSLHWLDRKAIALAGARAETRAGIAAIAAEIDERAVDAIVLHYSVFAFAHRGLPVFSLPVLAELQRRAPLVSVLHEAAYPWHLGGPRGTVWALSQRAALVEVVRRSAALLVTIDVRARWLASRPWLARRPMAVAPVFSTLPIPASGETVPHRETTVGLFGYAHEGSQPGVVLDALRLVRDGGVPARLLLLGSPGPDSVAARRWQLAADERRLGDALCFSGILPAAELSDSLSACEVLLFADSPGPTSRKTTLAALLASGRPVLAIDGPGSWPELVRAGAALIAAPDPLEVAGGLRRLMQDAQERSALGARGRRFYEQTMAVEHSARALVALLDQVAAPATAPARDSHAARAVS
jgi:glycosyltransferase involved in cell wall biosynthesis